MGPPRRACNVCDSSFALLLARPPRTFALNRSCPRRNLGTSDTCNGRLVRAFDGSVMLRLDSLLDDSHLSLPVRLTGTPLGMMPIQRRCQHYINPGYIRSSYIRIDTRRIGLTRLMRAICCWVWLIWRRAVVRPFSGR